MVVRGAELVFALLVPHDFQGAVGDNLVGVHVHRCSCAALHHVHWELVPKFSGHNFLAGCNNCIGNGLVQYAKFCICAGCGHFNVCHCDYVLRIIAHAGVGNLVIIKCTLGLYAVVGIEGNLKFAKEVALDPEFAFCHN